MSLIREALEKARREAGTRPRVQPGAEPTGQGPGAAPGWTPRYPGAGPSSSQDPVSFAATLRQAAGRPRGHRLGVGIAIAISLLAGAGLAWWMVASRTNEQAQQSAGTLTAIEVGDTQPSQQSAGTSSEAPEQATQVVSREPFPAPSAEPPVAARPTQPAPGTSPPTRRSRSWRDGGVFVHEIELEGGASLRLEGVVASSQYPVAVLNGRLLEPGELVLGFEVKRIGGSEVELQRDGVSITLRLP